MIDKHIGESQSSVSSTQSYACGDERLQFLTEQCSSAKQEFKSQNHALHSFAQICQNGNLEQVEATKLELKAIEKENADRNRKHTDQLRVHREEVKKYNEARDKYIILRIGQKAFDFYRDPPSFQKYEGLSVIEIELDKYNL